MMTVMINVKPRKPRPLTLDLLRIRRARVVRIDLLRRCALIERDEAVEEIRACSIVVVTACVVREVVPEW